MVEAVGDHGGEAGHQLRRLGRGFAPLAGELDGGDEAVAQVGQASLQVGGHIRVVGRAAPGLEEGPKRHGRAAQGEQRPGEPTHEASRVHGGGQGHTDKREAAQERYGLERRPERGPASQAGARRGERLGDAVEVCGANVHAGFVYHRARVLRTRPAGGSLRVSVAKKRRTG